MRAPLFNLLNEYLIITKFHLNFASSHSIHDGALYINYFKIDAAAFYVRRSAARKRATIGWIRLHISTLFPHSFCSPRLLASPPPSLQHSLLTSIADNMQSVSQCTKQINNDSLQLDLIPNLEITYHTILTLVLKNKNNEMIELIILINKLINYSKFSHYINKN